MDRHVRVGFGDWLWIGPGEPATTSADRVAKIRLVHEGLGPDVAGPDEARALLGLKGGDRVGFQAVRIGVVAAGGLRAARSPGKMGRA